MKANARELRSLRLLREQREVPPTFRRTIQRNGRLYLFLLACFLGSLWLMSTAAIEPLGTFFSGFFLAILLRDRTFIGMALRAWPLYREIIDWSKVDTLIAEAERGPP